MVRTLIIPYFNCSLFWFREFCYILLFQFIILQIIQEKAGELEYFSITTKQNNKNYRTKRDAREHLFQSNMFQCVIINSKKSNWLVAELIGWNHQPIYFCKIKNREYTNTCTLHTYIHVYSYLVLTYVERLHLCVTQPLCSKFHFKLWSYLSSLIYCMFHVIGSYFSLDWLCVSIVEVNLGRCNKLP